MISLLHTEWIKMRKSYIWMLIFVSPLLAFLVALGVAPAFDIKSWLHLMGVMISVHAMLFLPLLTGVFAAFICRYEHTGGGWKQLLALPVSRTNVYMSKYFLVLVLLAATQLLFLAGLLGAGFIIGLEGPIPWTMILKGIFGGWIATFPLAALQMLVSTAWSSFAAPLALNVIFTIPNILIANSEKYGPYYPWSQPMLSMLPKDQNTLGAFYVSLETLLLVIVGSFLLFLLGGLLYFNRKEM